MGIVKIDQCTVNLTYQCNLNCSFCYAKQARLMEHDTVTYENLVKAIDFCAEANVKYLLFIGGEPTLFPKLIEVLKYMKSKNYSMTPSIATNGILMENPDYCKSLVENGIKYIDISLKGKNSTECSNMTGYDCFLQQSKAIRNLSTLPVEFTCSMVLKPETINSMCDAVKNASDNGAKQFSFTFIIDNENSKDNDESYLMKHNPFALIEAFISKIDDLNSVTKDWWIEYSFPLCVYTEEQLSILKGKLADPCLVHYEKEISFDTDLNLIPCDMFFREKIGQLGVDFASYTEFLEYSAHSTYRSTIDRLKEYPSVECKTCRRLESCHGGCPAIWKNYSFDSIRKLKEKYYSNSR